MRYLTYGFGVLFSFALMPAFSQTYSNTNPLLVHSNSPIPFDKVDAKMIRQAVGRLMHQSDSRVKNIISGLKPGTGPGSLLAAYDQLNYELDDLAMKLELIQETSVSDSTRNAANNGSQALADYQTSLVLNESLYKSVKSYAAGSMKLLKPNQQKYIKEQLQIFENNGVMDAKTGQRYRKEILEVAGSQQEMDMLRHFLGREPNSDAFMRSIGL